VGAGRIEGVRGGRVVDRDDDSIEPTSRRPIATMPAHDSLSGLRFALTSRFDVPHAAPRTGTEAATSPACVFGSEPAVVVCLLGGGGGV
jgi:hypothetical protein